MLAAGLRACSHCQPVGQLRILDLAVPPPPSPPGRAPRAASTRMWNLAMPGAESRRLPRHAEQEKTGAVGPDARGAALASRPHGSEGGASQLSDPCALRMGTANRLLERPARPCGNRGQSQHHCSALPLGYIRGSLPEHPEFVDQTPRWSYPARDSNSRAIPADILRVR
ncbi:hypothetical protein [Streptomyces sp. ISL-24]|uniref:hypothetical protein n=1 Tax=Streptomyces sp. ISL-24 TaxID=2819181 RepID=UPI002034D062|nr:hypothetical protein [Streptomyces sp. ISL-24]